MNQLNSLLLSKSQSYNAQPTETEFDSISISIASPERIKSWSYGEVTKTETINYRTFKPEKDGLFCAKIFGPIKDYECLCGKYKRMKYKGIVCEKCGVEVIQSRVRRERMGHILLASPVAHIWFYKPMPSKIALLLDISSKHLESVLYFENYIVIDPGVTDLQSNQVLSDEEYEEAVEMYGREAFKAGMGAEAVREILENLNLEYEQAKLSEQLKASTSEMKAKKISKKLRLIESFIKSKTKPEWMLLTVLPVLSPELRPLVPLDGGRFASSDLNDLYRRVINRNNRLKRLIALKAPDIIVRNEKRMLQESVDALFDNSRRTNPITDNNKRPLKSFSDVLKGKQGRFRQNLLGKRVDYSGRSVITVGPYLKLHECGLPKKIALELFKPFIYSKLQLYGQAATIKMAKKIVEKERPEVWDILEELIKEHPILLNRAPTLHRLGIQAFEPKLIEGKAIHLHPLVCAAFNADFDGDQMAIHVPLSLEAKLEARVLMLSTNNILSPANGKPVIVPSQDIVLGLYYLSLIRDKQQGEGKFFGDLNTIELALEAKAITLHTKIKYRLVTTDAKGERVAETIETSPGRVILYNTLPEGRNMSFTTVNKLLTSKEISSLIEQVFVECGQGAVVEFVDKIMALGFEAACKAGISIGKNDLIVPKEKNKLVKEAELLVLEYDKEYRDGLITKHEKYNKVIDTWSKCTDKVGEVMMEGIFKIEEGRDLNSVYMMAHSGARSSPSQMKQLAGMRGLMAKPSGEIIETPIISNFKEGLHALEYFNSTHGARKGLADTALKTANAGYLTRRLVDVAQDCIITNPDCGTEEGIYIKETIESGKIVEHIGEKVLGRYTAEPVLNPKDGKLLVDKNVYITADLANLLKDHSISRVKIRSPLTCESLKGICVKCYGEDLSRGAEVKLGESVGVVAAQSIGEPGTQLTMRTFHIGGAVHEIGEKNTIESPVEGIVELTKCNVVNNSDGIKIVMSKNSYIAIKDEYGQEKYKGKIPYGSKLYVSEGEKVAFNTKLVEWDAFSNPVIGEVEGWVNFVDMIDNVTLIDQVDEVTGVVSKVIVDRQTRAKSVTPCVVIVDKEGQPVRAGNSHANYILPVGAIMAVEHGQHVKPGDVLAKIPRESTKAHDITGGLPRVIELFEARKYPKENSAILSDVSGVVSFNKSNKNKLTVVVKSDEDGVIAEYSIAKDKQLLVLEGEYIEKGAQIVDGLINPHDILRTQGVPALAEYMISEVQSVYKMQGVNINNKHIEVIVRQMLKMVVVTNPGDSSYMVDDEVNLLEVIELNKQLLAEDKRAVEYAPILQSITRASLRTESFISAASFQETTKILTEAALLRKVDHLEGLKENVIMGRLIPVGTGFWYKANKNRDKKVLETLD